MQNPYAPPQATKQRVFKTPIIVPLSVLMVVLIYGGYALFFLTGEETGLFAGIKGISFELFLLCETGILTLIFYNKTLLNRFLTEHPVIDSRKALGPVDTNLIVTVEPKKAPIKARGVQFGRSK
ncbi:MAG: hypothetical protein MI754_11210 [Chromatiales bacterium]|nr:hypothetical protein [Chromatiales bacterium]